MSTSLGAAVVEPLALPRLLHADAPCAVAELAMARAQEALARHPLEKDQAEEVKRALEAASRRAGAHHGASDAQMTAIRGVAGVPDSRHARSRSKSAKVYSKVVRCAAATSVQARSGLSPVTKRNLNVTCTAPRDDSPAPRLRGPRREPKNPANVTVLEDRMRRVPGSCRPEARAKPQARVKTRT